MVARQPFKLLRLAPFDSVCWRCSQRSTVILTRSFAQSFAPRTTATLPPGRLKPSYFLSNGFLIRSQSVDAHTSSAPTASTSTNSPSPVHEPVNQDLPHRRRQAARRHAAAAATSSSSAPLTPESPSTEHPPDASSILTTAASNARSSFRRTASLLLSLSKPRLTVLVVLSAMASYALYPMPSYLSPAVGLDTPNLSPLTLAFLTTGTTLCSASANALNMLYEPKWDRMMTRTRNRPLAKGLLSTRAAVIFAVACATLGTAGLYFGVNPTVAALGAANIFIYAGIYTPMKRMHWLNTWAGAVVGGIPPLMGWAAAAGESATGDATFSELLLTKDAIGGWLLAALLFAWQFPHFMALSYNIKDEYRRAGHQMLSWLNPARNGRVALRYSLLFLPICFGMCYTGLTEWSFAVTSLPVNLWLSRAAVKFWKYEGLKNSARGLFWASVWHLPVVMALALLQKKGMWQRVWRSVFGELEYDDQDDEWEEFEEGNAELVPLSAQSNGLSK